MGIRPLAPLVLAACGACISDPKTGAPIAAPEAAATNVVGYVENARGFPDDVVYGWDVRVAAGVARWRECATAEACSEIERERPAAELVAFHSVGRAPVGDGDAGDVDVFRLTVKTRRRNIMPRSP